VSPADTHWIRSFCRSTVVLPHAPRAARAFTCASHRRCARRLVIPSCSVLYDPVGDGVAVTDYVGAFTASTCQDTHRRAISEQNKT